MLSSLSVSHRPEICLRFRCSSRYLRIPPLHLEFQFPLRYSSPTVSNAVPELSSGISRQTYQTTCGPFTPNESEQRSPPTYYRGCWHVVSRGFLQRYRHLFRPSWQRFTIRRPSSRTRHCWVRLSPIAQNSRLQPPVGVWVVLSPSVAGRPLRPATHHCLGGPLPHQLANGTRAPPQATFAFNHKTMQLYDHIRY